MIRKILLCFSMSCLFNSPSCQKAMEKPDNPRISEVQAGDRPRAVELRPIELSLDSFMLEFKNKAQAPLYLAYNRNENSVDGRPIDFVPFAVSCRDEKTKMERPVGKRYDVLPSLQALNQGESVIFLAEIGDAHGDCVISVRYYEDRSIAEMINRKIPYLSEDDHAAIEVAKRTATFEFVR